MTDKVYIDTNVAADMLLKRTPFFEEAAKIFSYSDRGKINITFSSLSFSTLEYILSKVNGKEKSKSILKKFRPLVNILTVDEKIIDCALTSNFTDFEDAIQYEVAKANQQELIISRNTKDFKKSEIPVFTPKEYLIILKGIK